MSRVARPLRDAVRPPGGARAFGPLPARALRVLLVAALAGLLLGRFLLAGAGRGTDAPAGGPAATASAGLAGSGAGDEATVATVARLQAQLAANPDQPVLLTQLGAAYLTRARETADPSYYSKAADALARSQQLDGGNPETMTALGLLALARHDFRAALAWGERAHRLAPAAADPLGVIVDAQVELGRYQEAAASAQAMVDRKPNLASLARVSYVRELLGDPDGALLAMEQAVAAGAGSAADRAYVQVLVGDLRLGRGQLDQAQAAYQAALGDQQGYGPAEVGLAEVAVARGQLRQAAALLAPVAARLPLPATVALLGDVQAALGQLRAAAGQYRLVRAIEALNRANGVAVDLELARFEANHAGGSGGLKHQDPGAASGDPGAAVALARTALAARPTIFAEDVLGWALRQAGRPAEALPHARAAVRLGTRDALLWYHLAAIEADLGQRAAAGRDLGTALRLDPYLMTPSAALRDRGDALALARRLGVAVPSPAAAAEGS